MATESLSFELQPAGDPNRLIRVRVESPAGVPGSGERRPFVMVLHGFKGFMDWGFFPELSRRLADAGLVAVSFNMSGSGIGADLETFTDDEGFAGNTYTREIEDSGLVRAHAASGNFPWIDPQKAAMFGHSRGGGIALLHAAEAGDYRALVTWAAIASVNRWDDATRKLWREQGFLLIPNARTGQTHRLDVTLLDEAERHGEGRLDVVAACGRIQAPTLLVHGEADEAVPFADLETLAAGFPSGVAERLAVANAGHTFGARHPLEEIPAELDRVLERTVGWFTRHLT